MNLGDNDAFCVSAAQNDAISAAASALRPKPPVEKGFVLSCDSITCPQGLNWNGPGRSVIISSCSKCGEARYCSQVCQRNMWSGKVTTESTGITGHKAYCGKLRSAPRPLRLIHSLVNVTLLESMGLVKLNNKAPNDVFDYSNKSMGVDVEVKFSDSLWSKKHGVLPDAAVALRKLMDKLKPTRLVLIVPHMWAHAVSGSGDGRPPDVTMFDVDGNSVEELCFSLVKGVETALPYMYDEEDRLAEGVRYAPSTFSPKLGEPCPPRTARLNLAQLGPGDIVVKTNSMFDNLFGGGGVLVMGPARWRWATMGPFQLSEMPMEDLSLTRIQFYHPVKWPPGWFTVVTKLVA